MYEFLTSLAIDFANLLDVGDDHNVLINVGQDPHRQSFKAHSVVLRARSPYFKTALSNDWIRKEGSMTLLIASDELLLSELQEYIQEYLLTNKSNWLHQNFALVHQTVFQLDSSKDLQEFFRPFKKILPKELYEDLKRYHFQAGMQLKPEYLQAPRYKGIKSTIIEKPHSALIAYWIDGGDNTSLPSYPGELQYEFKLLVRGSRDGFSAATFHDRCDNQGPTITLLKVNNSKHVIGGYNPLSWGSTNTWRYTRDSFICQFNIDYKKKMVAKLGRVIPACSQYAISDSQYNGPCFGDGDLWITDDFNLAGNCSCNKESYEQSVGDMFHRESWDSWNGKNGTFAVDDYEVFQVVKLRLSDQ
ncbi:2294_t:CDS:2 [Cetraspora pellucida]|uniref:2294_t:CDS:1 n=1 Tax=Cetraspora pellucida TaxID=1433469 RepID=A0A9N9C3H8_9GLOM|nr:2294_t:CDS:2 [Cetraspora pellucida]